MKNVITIREWNWRGAASAGWDNEYRIMPWMVDRVLEGNPDVISINEFVISDGWDYFKNALMGNGYCWFMRYTTYENGVLIALKLDTFNIKTKDDVSVAKQVKKTECIAAFPDFLAITVKYGAHPLTIVGTRIKVLLNSNCNEDFKFRKLQFDALVDYLSTIEGRMLVMGDFNSGAIFNEFDKNHLYDNCSRQYYSYQMIWRAVEDLNLSLHTPDKGGKYGNKYSIVTFDSNLNKAYYTKEDHLISRGFNIRKCDYIWDFVKPENGYGSIGEQDYKGSIKFVPDHAILSSELVVNNDADYKGSSII